MKKIEATLVWQSPSRGTLLECPLWDHETLRLYWIDVVDPAVHCFDFSTQIATSWPLPKPPGSAALISRDRLLIAMRSSLAILDTNTGSLLPLPTPELGDERFNDGACDAAGNFWVGTMDRTLKQPVGRAFRFTPELRFTTTPMHAILSNGMCFSPDGRHLYFSRTFERQIYRYDLDPATGALSAERLLVTLDEAPGRPDGCTVDASGALWSARVGGARIDRYADDGRSLGSLALPTSHPTHCVFGGANLNTLFVTTSRYGRDFEHHDDPAAGFIYAYEVAEHGMTGNRFQYAAR